MQPDKPQASSDSKLHFLDYWRIIRIRRGVILAVFLLVVVTTTVVTFLLPESYASSVRIDVNKNAWDIAPLGGGQTAETFDPYYMETEFKRITSKEILYPVITNLSLNVRWAKKFDSKEPLEISQTYDTLKKLMDVNQIRNTSLIEITVYDEDAVEAANIANAIAQTYKQSRMNMRADYIQKGIDVLTNQLTEKNKEVTVAQKKVDDLRITNNIADAYAEGGAFASTDISTVQRTEAKRVDALSEYVQSSALLTNLQTLSGNALSEAVAVAYPDTQLPTLLGDLNTAEQQIARMTPELGPRHPDLLKLENLKAQIQTQIDDTVLAITNALKFRVDAQKQTMEQMAAEVEKAKKKEANETARYREYYTAKRELENLQRIRDALQLRMLQETVDKSIPKTSVAEITDQAEPGKKPVRPDIPLNIALGVIVGLVLGVGLAFFIEYLDTSVKTIDDVERALQAPVLGVIPQNVSSLLAEGPETPHAEAYRVLRTNILFSRKEDSHTTLTVVSGGAGEGKSTTIFNLAIVFAQNGQRVLVVDSDLRRPSIHKLLNVSNSTGLTNFLLGQNTLEEVIQTTELPALDFLPSGKLPSSSMGILNSSQMKEFIREAKARYDFVFFDSPPIMGVSDASILASEVDLTLLVIQYRKYPQAMTIRAKQMVEKVGGCLLGVVLNNINISQDSYYYYYSGYYYDYYSKREEDEASPKNNGESEAASRHRGQLDLKRKY